MRAAPSIGAALAGLASRLKPARKGEPLKLQAGVVPMASTIRGLRNNNPGNIDHSPSHWLGQAEVQTDPRFVQFTSMAYGVRALAVTLLTYQRTHGCRTVADFIGRWAPPSENNTAAYVKSVCQVLHVQPADAIDVTRPATMTALCCGIIQHENGLAVSLSSALGQAVRAGVNLALGVPNA